MMKLTICKLCDSAKTPSYAHDDDACFDLHAAEPTVLPANAAAIVPTGLAELGFEPRATVKAAKHYPAASVPAICQALIARLQGVTAEA